MFKASLMQANGRILKHGLYDPSFERDNCGVGLVAKIDGEANHTVVKQALQLLVNLEHRGALGGDKSTGDGAGIMIDLPHKFFNKHIELPELGDYAVGMIFFPKEESLYNICKNVIKEVVEKEGAEILHIRKVPTNSSFIGELARTTEPYIEQVFIGRKNISKDNFERKLYVIRKQIENTIKSNNEYDLSQFYICSFSSIRIVYKGLFTAHQIENYYPDLNDEDFVSKYCIVHQRYSTNTQPTWNLAQPFRFVAHNGEINTLSGNILRMKIREASLESELFGDDIAKIKPVIDERGSDSAIFDNVLELLVMGGRSLPHAMMMMIPEAYGPKIEMSEDKKAFYDFHSAIMEPWDGPAAMVFTDGRYLGATLDRNGLRPARYTVTKDGYLYLASETGAVEVAPSNVLNKGRLSPGRMLLLDFEQKRIVPDKEIKSKISRQKPYRRWIKENIIKLRGLFTAPDLPEIGDEEKFLQRLHVFGYTQEELKTILNPMAANGQEAVGSMGNDTPLAVLSDKPNLLFYYFKQRFAQVTNPAIDPIREEMVMSLESFIGGEGNLLQESPTNFRGFKLNLPIITPGDLKIIEQAKYYDMNVKYIDMLFDKRDGVNALEIALNRILEDAKKTVVKNTIFILTDRNVDENHVPIPSLLAVSALYHFLIDNGLRSKSSVIVETGEAREVMNFAMLISYGADAICPYVAFETIKYMTDKKLLEKEIKPEEALDNYIIAVKKGLLKTTSRLGISTLHSYFGSQIFEAIGISKELINKYFTGTICRFGGIDLSDIQKDAIRRHERAFNVDDYFMQNILEPGGEYSVRLGGEKHFWNGETIAKLQLATRLNDYKVFKEYTKIVNDGDNVPLTIRRLLKFKETRSISIDEVEPVESIVKRFVVSAMSFGSISKETHEAIAIAVNRIGARSNSGEGGEGVERSIPLPNGDSKRSKVKQVASGRFGVTLDYLLSADELQIKIAQGAKPGEGGQLPGHKVTEEIARVRHTTPGVTLISPPPHHDIYSIEDIAQLIYDLKCVNPDAKVSVKLVSETGVGTIASGVAKAKADIILISGYEGGTGASPLTSIKHTGIPWEIGLAETHQTLIQNKLRDKVKLQVDGQLKTGRDLAIAILLGAEEFGFATSVLITLGCMMLRKCHNNTCSVGVATQDPVLRERFKGKPEYIINYFYFLAQDLREIMATLGFRTIDEMVGRSDLLEFVPPENVEKAKKFDLNPLFNSMVDTTVRCSCSYNAIDNHLLDTEIIEYLNKNNIDLNKQSVELEYQVRNVNRTIGARLSGYIAKKYGSYTLKEDALKLKLKGSAGQSFGAFLAQGVTLHLEGEANDYVGKGLCGGKIVIETPKNASFDGYENIICGNVALYGATRGEVYINGRVGERFAVRNSGATVVVEGVGDHGCEYMTGGTVVCIGPTGKNFAAGMSGGIAYVFDETQLFDRNCNLDMVELETVWNKYDEELLKKFLLKHIEYTDSKKAKQILAKWEYNLPLFVKVVPIEYRQVLERIQQNEKTDIETVAATEEVFNG